MKTNFRKRWYLFVPLGILVLVGCVFAAMALWNWLMPLIFHLPELTFWQILGLMILSRIILGGRGHHPHPNKFAEHRMKGHLFDKWEKMTPEEREKFRENIRLHRSSWSHNWSEED
jgi:hypothetical protein